MSIVEFFLGFVAGIGFVSLGWVLGYRANSKRYWDGYSRGYAQAETDRDGLSAESAVRIYQ
jgi:hypothetical protein